MGLIPDKIRQSLPGLGSVTRGKPMQEWVAQARFIDPEMRMSWYLIEFDGQDRFFGLMAGKHCVAGEFSLTELESLGGEGDAGDCSVHLDRSFQPAALIDLARQSKAIAELLPLDDLVDLAP